MCLNSANRVKISLSYFLFPDSRGYSPGHLVHRVSLLNDMTATVVMRESDNQAFSIPRDRTLVGFDHIRRAQLPSSLPQGQRKLGDGSGRETISGISSLDIQGFGLRNHQVSLAKCIVRVNVWMRKRSGCA
jgi:hypothetical protein